MKPRTILLADFSKTETGDKKIRPVLVVSEESFNGLDVIILPISCSADVSDPGTVVISHEEFPATGLKKDPSCIRWTKPTTMPKSILKKASLVY